MTTVIELVRFFLSAPRDWLATVVAAVVLSALLAAVAPVVYVAITVGIVGVSTWSNR